MGPQQRTSEAGEQTLGRNYDEAGRLLTEDLPGSYVVTYVYDGASRLKSKATERGATAVSGVEYDYDDSGNRTQMLINRGGSTVYTIDYTYTLSSQLLTEVRKDDQQATVYDDAYTYDLAGNRLKRVRVKSAGTETTWYAYDSRNHLKWEHTAKPGNVEEGIEYGYDENGCQVVKKKGDSDDIAQVVLDGEGNLVEIQWVAEPTLDVEEYAYSYEQRLTRYEDASDVATVYGFDDQNRRVYRKVGTGSDERFLYDGEDTVYEDGVTTSTYVNGLGIDEKRLVVRATNTYVYLSDGLGSTRELMNTAGAVKARYDYSAWGEDSTEVWNDETLVNVVVQAYKYTGRRQDSESKLY